jgi:hypothetical protein
MKRREFNVAPYDDPGETILLTGAYAAALLFSPSRFVTSPP